MDIEDYTQNPLAEEGVFRAFPVSWTVEEPESGAVAIAFRFAIRAKWHRDEKAWSQDWPVGYFTENRTWIVGRTDKGGNENAGAIKNLAACGLWDGDWDKLGGPVPSVFVLIDVGVETYEGKTRYRADWVNPDAEEPQQRGGFKPANPENIASLRARFQSKTRALAGGGAAGTPPAPPTASPAMQPGQPAPAPVAAPAPAPGPTPAPVAAPVAPAVAPVAAPAPTPAPPAVAQPAPAQPPAAPAAPPAQPPPVGQGFLPPAAGTLEDPIDPDDTPF